MFVKHVRRCKVRLVFYNADIIVQSLVIQIIKYLE